MLQTTCLISQRVAGPDTMGDMFFSALGGAKDQYRSAVTGAFSAVDDAMVAAGLKNFGIVPFGKLTIGLKEREISTNVKTIHRGCAIS